MKQIDREMRISIQKQREELLAMSDEDFDELYERILGLPIFEMKDGKAITHWARMGDNALMKEVKKLREER